MKISEHRISQWANTAKRRDDYQLSYLFWLLASNEELGRAIKDTASLLGAAGYRGCVYMEQADIGNGLQDIGNPRVHIDERDGTITETPYNETIPSRKIAKLATFPLENNQWPVYNNFVTH